MAAAQFVAFLVILERQALATNCATCVARHLEPAYRTAAFIENISLLAALRAGSNRIFASVLNGGIRLRSIRLSDRGHHQRCHLQKVAAGRTHQLGRLLICVVGI